MKEKSKERYVFNLNIDDFLDRLLTELNSSFDKEVREKLKKITVEYRRDKQKAINTGITANIEEKVKAWICPRIPEWVNSDHLTVLGVFAILLCSVGFVLGFYDHWYLSLVVVGLFLHWFGDTFDGSLARYRKKTRPNYGYYIDHIVDAVSVIIFSLGLGISGFVRIDLALLFAVMYLALIVHVELVTFVQNKFKYTFGLFGPTEMRIIGVFVVVYMFFSPVKYYPLLGHYISQYDFVFLIMSVLMGVVLLYNLVVKAIELDRKDRAKWKENKEI